MNVKTLLKSHKSVRKFKERMVNDELVKDIVRCAQHAATSEFIQSYTIIRIKDQDLQKPYITRSQVRRLFWMHLFF